MASYLDDWGTRVDTLRFTQPHDRLEVYATATVETQEPVRPTHRIATEVDDDVVALAQAVNDHVAGFDYRGGVTEVGSRVEAVLAAGGGVCQDFAYLSIALLRELGVPARYVSGYLFTVDDATGADTALDEVEVETHAWIEAAIPGWGWFALDPTNAQHVTERHVTIGRGRDYVDVAPLQGFFVGDQRHELEVSVSMRRLALAPLGDQSGGRAMRQ